MPNFRKILLKAPLVWSLFLVAMLFAAVYSGRHAQAAQTIPYKINFQGRLTDNNGNIVSDGLYNVKFTIFNAASGGSQLWQEFRQTTNRVQITNGLFDVRFGDVTALSPTLFDDSTQLYLQVELPTPATATCSTSSCGSFTEGPLTPRQPIAATPYAFNSDTIDGIDGSSLARNDQTNTFTADQVVSGELSATTLLQGGNDVCDDSNNCNYAATSGGAGYIQNQTVSPQTAGFNITGNGTIGGNLAVTGTINTNTLSATALTFSGANPLISPSTTNTGLAVRSNGSGTLTLDSGTTGSIEVGTGNNAKSINIGTGSTGAKTITIGSVVTGTNVSLVSAGAPISLSTLVGDINVNTAGSGTINVGTTAVARSTNIGTGAAAQTVTVGSTNTTSTTTVQSGSGGINLNGATSITGNTNITGSVTATSFVGDGSALTNLDAGDISTGTLGVARGGTGAATHTAGGVLFGNGTSAIQNSGVLTNGQLLIGDGTGAPTVGTLTAGTGIGITNGAGSITVAVGSTVTLQGNTFNGASQLVQLNASSQLPAVSGVNLTNLNATNLASGTVNTARIAGSYTGITGTGALTAGSIASGFGSINIGASVFTGDGSGLTNLDATDLTGTIASARLSGSYTGITGTGALTAGSIASGFGNINIGSNTFTGNGSGLTTLNASNISTGTLAVAQGGTGAATHTAGAILFGNGTSAVTNSGVLTNGQLLIGDGTGAPTVGTLTAGTGIGVTNGAGSITLAVDSTVCTTGGNCAGVGGTGDILQGGNSFVGAMTIGTNNAQALNLETNGVNRLTIDNAGAITTTGDLTVGGTVSGNGSGLTTLSASNLSSGTVNTARIAGSYTGITGTGALTAGSIASGFGNINIGSNTFTGNGSGLTALNASNVSSGTLAVAQGGTGAATLTAGGILFGNGTSAVQNSGVLTNGQLLIGDGTGAPTVGTLTAGTGIGVTNGAGTITIAADSTVTLQGNTFNGASQLVQLNASSQLPAVSGALLTNLDATDLTGTIASARISGSYTGITGTGALTVGSIASGFGSINIGSNTFTGNGSGLTALNASNISTGTLAVAQGGTGAGTHTAGGILFGNGTSAVTNSGVLTNGQLLIGDGTGAPTAATLTQGTGISISNGAGSITISAGATVTLQGNTFNGASQLVQLNASSQLPAVSGALLTNLDATDLTGTIASARLSGSYTGITGTGALTAGSIASGFGNINIGANTFTGNGSGLTALNGSNISTGTVADGRLSGNVALYNAATANFTGTLQQAGNDVCTTVGNCTSSGSLQDAYDNGGEIQLAASGDDLRITNDSGKEILFADKTTGFIGMGTVAPSAKLEIVADPPSLNPDINDATFATSWNSTIIGAAESMNFSPDGSHLWTLESNAYAVGYDVSSPHDVSSANWVADYFDITSQTSAPVDISSNSSGTRMYVLETSTGKIYQYDLSNPWELASATYDDVYTSTQADTATNITFKPDGTKLYMTDPTDDRIYQYTLGTPWDVTTATYDTVSFLTTTQSNNPTSMFLNSSGTKLYVMQATTFPIFYQYTLSTPWVISSASYDSISLTATAANTGVLDATMSSDNERFYATRSTVAGVAEYHFEISSPSGPLVKVSGEVQADSLTVGGSAVCTISNNCSYAPASGSANYIHDTSTVYAANVAVQSATSNTRAGLFKGHTSQSASVNIFEVQNSSSTPLFGVSNIGAVTVHTSTNSASAFSVENTGGTPIFNVNTSTPSITLGSGGTAFSSIKGVTINWDIPSTANGATVETIWDLPDDDIVVLGVKVPTSPVCGGFGCLYDHESQKSASLVNGRNPYIRLTFTNGSGGAINPPNGVWRIFYIEP